MDLQQRPDWQQRVILELQELDEKRGRLTAFLMSEQFESLQDGEKSRLRIQNDAMRAYRDVLVDRIAAFDDPQ